MLVSFTCVLEVCWVLLWRDGDTLVPWELEISEVPFHYTFPLDFPSYPRHFVLGQRYQAQTLPDASATVYFNDFDVFRTAYYDHGARLGETLS